MDLVLLFLIQCDGFKETSVFKVSVTGFATESSICAAAVSIVGYDLNLILMQKTGS